MVRKKEKTTAEGGNRRNSLRSDNPMDWLFDNPEGAFENFGFGVLRQTYRGFPNLPSEFGWRKLRPAKTDYHAGLAREDISVRSDVVLPPGSQESLADPVSFLKALDDAVLPKETAMLVAVTITSPCGTSLPDAWENVRLFARTSLAMARDLPVLMCQHNPGLAGYDNPPHVHLLISPRRWGPHGFSGYDELVASNDGQRYLFDRWTAFQERMGGP